MKKLLQISLALATAFGAFAAQAQDVKAGEKKIAMCIGCHGIPGYQASFPEVHKVPMIAGQNAKYIVSALQAYAKGDRKHPTMRGIATSLTEQDMNDIGEKANPDDTFTIAASRALSSCGSRRHSGTESSHPVQMR